MTIPVYVVGTISVLLQAYYSNKMQQRALFLVGSAIPVITGYLIWVGTANAAAGYVATFLLATGKITVRLRHSHASP